MLEKLISMVSAGNAEETETVQQIENVTGHNVLKPPVLCFSPTLCHFCAFHVSGSGVPLPGLRAPEPRAGTGSALSRLQDYKIQETRKNTVQIISRVHVTFAQNH